MVGYARRQYGHWKSENSIISIGALAGPFDGLLANVPAANCCRGGSSVMAKIPLAELFGYTSDLRSATGGTASFSMEFSHYAPVREELADLPKKDDKRK